MAVVVMVVLMMMMGVVVMVLTVVRSHDAGIVFSGLTCAIVSFRAYVNCIGRAMLDWVGG